MSIPMSICRSSSTVTTAMLTEETPHSDPCYVSEVGSCRQTITALEYEISQINNEISTRASSLTSQFISTLSLSANTSNSGIPIFNRYRYYTNAHLQHLLEEKRDQIGFERTNIGIIINRWRAGQPMLSNVSSSQQSEVSGKRSGASASLQSIEDDAENSRTKRLRLDDTT